MSRSYRKPYSAITGVRSAAHDKMVARRCHRRMQNQTLREFIANSLDWDDFVNPKRHEASFNDVWGWGRDGNNRLQFPPEPPYEHDLNWSSQEVELKYYERALKWYARLHRK